MEKAVRREIEKKDEENRGITAEEKEDYTDERTAYRNEYDEVMEQQIEVDHLTGLKNRRFFDKELEQSLRLIRKPTEEQRKGALEKISLILIDLDHFKDVNDTLGHPAGDEVLRRVAAVLTESVRDTDTAARYGGEELVVLMQGADAQVAARHAEEIRAKLEQLKFDDYPELKVTASFGVASSEESDNGATLVEYVDQALYKAKEGGRNRVEVYKESNEE